MFKILLNMCLLLNVYAITTYTRVLDSSLRLADKYYVPCPLDCCDEKFEGTFINTFKCYGQFLPQLSNTTDYSQQVCIDRVLLGIDCDKTNLCPPTSETGIASNGDLFDKSPHYRICYKPDITNCPDGAVDAYWTRSSNQLACVMPSTEPSQQSTQPSTRPSTTSVKNFAANGTFGRTAAKAFVVGGILIQVYALVR